MIKLTYRYIFILVLLMGIAHTEQFVIKLASYTNQSNLLKQVSLLSKDRQENIIFVKEKDLYKIFSKSSPNKIDVLQLLPHYRKVFSDAYIMIDPYKKEQKQTIDIYLALQKESNITIDMNTSIPISTTLMYPSRDRHNTLSLQSLLRDKIFYLSPQNINAKSEKILIKASFSQDTVIYKTLLGNVPDMNNTYTIQKNRLYLVNNNQISPSQYSTIDKIIFEYMLVSRWYKGKRIHQMRYYKNEEDARSYIESITLY